MRARNARVNVVLEKHLYAAVDEIAKRKGLSRSMVIRDLVRDVLEIREDLALSAFAEHREKTLESGEMLSHEDTWSQMRYALKYHPLVKTEDIPRLDKLTTNRIKQAIEKRLTTEPQKYGEPLRKTLKGFWKLRVGDCRVVFRVEDDSILVLGIIHRKEVYQRVEKSRI